MIKAHEQMILRYATLMSQEKPSQNDIDEMQMIEDQLHLTPDRILQEATALAISNVR
ncbi:MAG: hypothetical protein WCT07_02510 [Candidatus Paceibacterota bacterium]|jgi:hypothetical protein